MKITRLFIWAACVTAVLAGSPSFALNQPGFDPGSVADQMGRLFPSFRSYVVKVDGATLYITSPEWGALAEGGFFEVTDGSGARLAVAKIKKVVEEKFAVCEIVQSTGEIKPGRSLARGFKAPVRMLWMWDKSSAGAIAISSIEEELRDRGMFDLVPPIYSMAAASRLEGEDVVRSGSSAEIRKVAQALNVEIAVSASIKNDSVRVIVSLAGGETLAEIVSGPAPPSAPVIATASRTEPETDSAMAESIAETGESGKGTFVFKKWSGVVYHPVEPTSKTMDVRERARWKKYTVDNVALSVEPAPNGRLVVVFADSVRLLRKDGDKVSTLWETRAPSDTKLVSAASADMDGDGVKEVFVNAAGKEGLRSFVLKVKSDSASVIADGMNYYFSALAGATPLAQRGADGAPFLTGETFTVIKSGEELSFIPAFSIKDKDTPVGLVRVDVNGDGALEAVGINSKGALTVYSQSGETVWKASEFGLTGRNLHSLAGSPVPAPPRVLPVMDPSAGLTLAVAGAEYERGGLFGGAKLVKGNVRFIGVQQNACVEEDRISSPEGWISDLIEGVNGGAPGYIRVIPGTLGDKSDIFLPVE